MKAPDHHTTAGNCLPAVRRGVWTRRAAGRCGIAIVVLLATTSCGEQRHSDSARVYRIGFGNDTPFHYPAPDGTPTGLAVDVVKEAARRRGIQLEWIRTTRGYREIVEGRIDLHVLISLAPERERSVYLARPYLSTETGFLVRAESPFHAAKDLAAARISFNGLSIHRQALSALLPRSTLTALGSSDEAVKAVQDGKSDGAYVDQFAGVAALVDGAAHSPLRIVASTVPRRLLTLASSFQAQSVADDLREEIATLSDRDELAPILARWSLFPALMAESTHTLDVERTKVKALAAGAAVLLLLLLVVAWLLWRLRHRTYSLRVSESRYRTVVENLGDGVSTVDSQGRFLLSNPAADGILGVPENGLAGRGLEDFLASEPGQDRQPPKLQSSEKLRFETSILRPDGTRRKIQVSSTPQFDRAGRLSGALVVLRDITNARELEEQIRLLAQALRCADDCITITDAEDRLIYINDAFLRTYGYEKHEVLGRHIGFVRSLRMSIEGAPPIPDLTALEHWRGELWNRTKDGREFLISLATAKVRDDDGAMVGLIGVARDITELKRAEEERINLQEQLTQAQKLESIGRLAGGVAHDFNNLLTVINGYSALLLKRDYGRDANRKRLELIRQAGGRAAELTQQLLAFGRKQMIQPKLLDMNSMVLETEKMIHRLLPENIEIVTSLEPALGLVMADPSQIHQMLLNLALNARDAMPQGGVLTMETANAEVDAQFASRHPEAAAGTYVQVSVTDTGVGMEESVRAHIFEPFFTTKGLGAGTGLGLASVYGIVRQSGGWIWVYSEPGCGTTFKIYLPTQTTSAPLEDGEVPGPQVAGGRETVLLVEDQDEVRIFAREVLQEHGYQVLEAPNGAAALALAQQYSGTIQLLLTDVVMPGMTGRELSQHLLAARPEAKVLYMSGYTEAVFTAQGVSKDDIAFLSKPVAPNDLLIKVRETLGPPRVS